jgi:nucleotide-binding universal stress UspA family protein
VEQTAAFVNRLPPSLVVSASHGVSGLQRLFIGTVVERLTRALDHPMLVVKPTDHPDDPRADGFSSAVVSCDSHGHWQRLAPLLRLLQPHGASRIQLVHALEGPMDKAGAVVDGTSYEQVQQALQERLHRRLRRQAQRLFQHAGGIFVAVAPGVPDEMVLRVAREAAAELIVVGVRRSGKVGRWISGSTTEALLRRSRGCVLTVPEPAEPESPDGDPR